MDREFEKTFERLCVTRTPRSVWDDFVALSAIAISNELDFRDDREELEASILEKYSNQEIWMMQELFDRTADVLEKNPNQDYLGELFSQFQWSGHGAAIAETERETAAWADLGEDERENLNRQLCLLRDHLEEQPQVAITYFEPDSRKEGGTYMTVRGIVRKMDMTERYIQMMDRRQILIDNI